jgi:hypothetical protein
MTWLFDTAPRVALRFVHVSSSEWSTCCTLVCPRVALRFVHVSFLVGPPFHFWLGHVFDSGCDTWLLLNAPRVYFQFHCQYTYNSQKTGISAYITYSYDTRHITDDTNTTGDRVFPECRLHSGKGQLHSGKPSPSATVGEEDPGKSFTGKPTSPRVKNRALGEYFPERHASTRG